MLIDPVIPGDRNVIKNKAERMLRYKYLTTEHQFIWDVKAKGVTVIIRATGTISKSFRQRLSNMLGKNKIKELQKTAILGTANIPQKVLM